MTTMMTAATPLTLTAPAPTQLSSVLWQQVGQKKMEKLAEKRKRREIG